jgi:integrase
MASEKGCLYRRGKTYWISLYDHGGRQQQFSTGTRDKREAERILRRKIADLDKGRPVSGPLRFTVKQLLDALEEDYKLKRRASLGRLKTARKHLEDFFEPSRKVLSIRSRDLRQYLLARTEDRGAMQSVRYELAMLRRALNLAHRDELIERVPAFPEFEPGEAREVYIPDGDHRAIVDKLPDPVNHLATFLFWSGWRVGTRGDEGALNLKWEDVDWAEGVLRAGSGSKTKKAAAFYFSEVEEVEALLRELRGRNEICVFARPDGRRVGYKFALARWREAQKEARVGPYRFHDYRRSVARRLEQGGIPRSTAKRITGHRTDRVFEKYAVGEAEDVRKALRAVTVSVTPEVDEEQKS